MKLAGLSKSIGTESNFYCAMAATHLFGTSGLRVARTHTKISTSMKTITDARSVEKPTHANKT